MAKQISHAMGISEPVVLIAFLVPPPLFRTPFEPFPNSWLRTLLYINLILWPSDLELSA